MSDNFESSLINLGELSKPATVLVEKISDAVGGIFKPYQIVRVAKAEAQADRVRAEGQIEISDLQRRAFHRFLDEEAMKQKNIEEITAKALPLLNEESQPHEIENDWIVNFFDRCRLISDDEMQHLWSRVLAAEANSPGKYSKRTLSFLTALDKREADMFTRLCGFVWDIGILVPFILSDFDREVPEIFRRNGINKRVLNDLESIGLIQLSSEGFQERFPKHPVSYFGKELDLQCKHPPSYAFLTGYVQLTRVGEELMPICGATPVEGFFELMLDYWKNQYWITVSELRADTTPVAETK